jgi:pimeloyl-ACP methyl ester carboxylesterase
MTDNPSIALTDCVLKSPGIENQVDAKCGSLTVSEDPSNSQSRQIDLNIAVVEAIRRSPEPDPLFILVGGPGQSAIETYPAISPTLSRIHEKRDIVLVDQRGTGKSHPLRCVDLEDETLEDDEVIALLKECPEKLDADLRFYTTDIAMQDLDLVRSALGYEAINLYGVSYGTRAALVYLKMYPERVRSVVLDAVVDPAFVLYQDAAQDGQQSLDLFFNRCEADTTCSSTYPSLRSEFDAVLGALEEKPVDITIPHPVTGKPLPVTITQRTFANIIFNTLYVPDLVAMLPLAIHQASAEDNYAPLITQAYLLDAGIYDGMFYAVACTEDAPLVTTAEDPDSIFGSSVQNFVEVCEAWPRGEPPQIVREPVSSDVPVLMLSGEADPITPPWHAEQLAGSLSNDLHLIFSGMGHGNAGTDCTRRIIDGFIEAASISGLDTTCVKSVEPPPFFVDFSGPQP